MSDSKRCKSCGNPVDLETAKAHDGACPWCLAAFTFSPEPVGNPAAASKDPSKQFGKYVRTERLGAGGMGEVWKALDTELNRWVALKFLKDEDPSVVARFQREAKTAASLTHPNIAAIYEVGEVDGRHFIAMQHIQGRTMATFPKKDRRLIVQLFRDAARAIDHAHRHGIIHRDLKPENLMVEENADGWSVVVLDFGLARPIEGGERLSQSGEVYGTAPYMSPEQARGEHLDERSDVYALGATMYDVLTGKTPFEGTNLLEVIRKVGNEEPVRPRKHNPRIHRDLETIILKCLEKDRERRYANARELAEDLERFLNSDPIVARPPSTLYRLRMKLGKRKAVVATAATGLLGIAIACFVILGGHDRQKEARDKAGTQVDLARLKIDQIDQLLKVDEDREREVELLASAARAELTEALRISPDHEDAGYEMGRMLSLTGHGSRALEYFAQSIRVAPRQTKAYLARATVNLDTYENLRHIRGSGGVREESEKSKRILAQVMDDLQRVRAISTEVPHLKYAQGMILFAKGGYAEAAERIGEYLALAPGDADAWVWRGHAQGHAGAHAEAVQSLTRGLKIRPRMSWAYVLRGNAYSDHDKYDEAIADHTRALELEPRDSVAYLNRGNARYLKGLHDEAIADFNKAIELNPTWGNAYNSRGNAKSMKGQHADAMADFTNAIELDPKDPRPYFNRGNTNRRRGLEGQAVADYTKSLELNPKDPKTWDGRGSALNALGRYDEALADYGKAIEIDPRYAVTYYNRGSAKSDKGLHVEAIADFTRAIELDPKMAIAWGNRGNSRKFLGQLDESLSDQDKCIELDPKNSKNYVNRGVARSAKGLEDEAIEDYSKAIQLNPKDELAWMNRGVGKFRKGLTDEALADLAKAIEVDPKCVPAYNNRASIRKELGLIEESIADCRKAIELDPKSSEACINWGVALHAKGLVDEAIAHYRKAIELDPDSALGYMNLGFAKETKELWDEALKDLKKSLALAPPGWHFRRRVEESLLTWDLHPAFQDARRLHRLKRYRESIEKYLPIVSAHPKTGLGNTAAFNIACGYALLGETPKALDWLEKAFEFGWADYAHAQRDTDLESLRAEERFRQILDRMKAAKKRKPAN